MTINNNITTLLIGAALLASCSEDLTAPAYTVGAADNAITLRAGIGEGGAGVQTRAVEYGEHTKHVGFAAGTQVALRIDGTWTGHSPVDVKTKTIATLGAKENEHNPLSTYSPNVYWDDYGTADPNNASTGRTQGLTIYGAAVDGKTTLLTTLNSLDNTVSTWQTLTWNVGVPGNGVIDQKTSGWSDYDLLTSNNVTTANNNAYTFAQKNDGKLLEFTHAMTKVTVNLKAGEGFPSAGDPSSHQFQQKPEVTLLGFNYTGTVNVEAKTSSPTSGTTKISAHLSKVKATTGAAEWSEAPATWVASNQTQFDAIVFPGNTITNTTTNYILEINADGNVYQINGTNLYAKMKELSHGYILKQAVNYILNITVNKTGIDVTATIKEWDTVNSAEEAPIININKCYGEEGTAFNQPFTFYRSTSKEGSYLTDGNTATVSYADNKYTMTPQLYWPNHSTHYFFRGIWPEVGSNDNESSKLGPATTDIIGGQKISVSNCAYKKDYYPSDLRIGMPRKADGSPDEECKANHKDPNDQSKTAQGICATDAASGATHGNEGFIHMNFQYAMSQVIVELKTSSDANNQITFDANTKVEIIGGYKEGALKLADGESDFTGKSVAVYEMTRETAGTHTKFHDAIIPQLLSNGTSPDINDLKFRITVGDGTQKDIYETVLGIKDIKVKEGSAEAKNITTWEPGKIYIYTLKITKTDIIVTATLKNWVEVTASEDIWF